MFGTDTKGLKGQIWVQDQDSGILGWLRLSEDWVFEEGETKSRPRPKKKTIFSTMDLIWFISHDPC